MIPSGGTAAILCRLLPNLTPSRRGSFSSRRMGLLLALNRHVERVFNPDRKDHHWGAPEAGAGSMTRPERKQDRLVYYAFDLLWRDGDIRKLPQIERKQMLSDLLGENDIELPIIYSEHLTGDGPEMFEHAAKLNFEGIVSKRADAPYRSERTEAWLKIKTVQKGQFPVIGFVKDPTGVAALYLGKREGKDLVYMGKVGTGWSRTVSSQIRKQFDTVVSPKSKLTKPIKKPKAADRAPSLLRVSIVGMSDD